MRDLVKEEWKPILGYEKFYEISNFGRIKSLARLATSPTHSYRKEEKIVKQGIGRGYCRVKLYNGFAKGKTINVHRLVALHFVDNPHNLSTVNHLDGSKLNNYYLNLEWCTHNYNVKHAYETGLKNPKNYKGEANKTSKLTNEIVISIRNKYSLGNISYPKLSKEYSVSVGNIYSIIKRKTWTHI